MRKLDIFIVRFLPFILFVILGINMLCCYCGIDITLFYELHGNSALYALGLFFISLANPKYHCVWNRAMYLFLVFVPTLNFIDASFDLISSDRIYMAIVVGSYLTTIVATAYLAIRHFVQGVIRKMNHGRK